MLCVAATGAVVSGLLIPLDVPGQDHSSDAFVSRIGSTRITSPPSISPQLTSLDRPLRSAMSDAAPMATNQGTTPSAESQPAAPFVLVGTIGESLAMFRMVDGSISIKGVGEQINGDSVVAIRPAEADLNINGNRTTLKKIKQEGP